MLEFFETKNGQLEIIQDEIQVEKYVLSKSFTAFQQDSIHNVEAFFEVSTSTVRNFGEISIDFYV